MAPLPNAARCVALEHHFTVGDDTHVLSRLHFRFGSDPTAADLAKMATTASASAVGAGGMGQSVRQQAVLNTIIATSLFDPTMPQGVAQPQFTGGRQGQQVPAETAFVIGYLIQRRYRGGHPRGYWPFGVAADMATPQTWADTFRSGTETTFRAYVSAIANAGYTGGIASHVNISYYSGSTWHQKPSGAWIRVANPRADPVVDNVVSQNARTRVGSQRRRMR